MGIGRPCVPRYTGPLSFKGDSLEPPEDSLEPPEDSLEPPEDSLEPPDR